MDVSRWSHLGRLCPTLNRPLCSPSPPPPLSLFSLLHVYPLPPFLRYHNLLQTSFASLEAVQGGKRSRERECKANKTSLSSLKQEHLLVVEVSVSAQPCARNTAPLVLMMHRSDGKEKREGLTQTDSERERGEVDGIARLLSSCWPLSGIFLPFLLLSRLSSQRYEISSLASTHT